MLPCSMPASWRTRMFPNLDLKFEVTMSNTDHTWITRVVGVPTWRGNSNSASSFQPTRLLEIKQLAFIPFLYQLSHQQNFEATLTALDETQKPISKPMPTMNTDKSCQIWTWILAQNQTWWKPNLALHHPIWLPNPIWFSLLKLPANCCSASAFGHGT